MIEFMTEQMVLAQAQKEREVLARIGSELTNKTQLRQHIARVFANDGAGPLRAWMLDVARDVGADEEIFVVGQAAPAQAAPTAIPWAEIDGRVQQLIAPLQNQINALPEMIRSLVSDEVARRPPVLTSQPLTMGGGGGYDPSARPAFAVSPGWGRR